MPSQAKQCRDHADECERLAAQTSDPEKKRSFLVIASTWRELADKLDQVAAITQNKEAPNGHNSN